MDIMFENVSDLFYMSEGEKLNKFKKGVSDAADAVKSGARSAWEGTKKAPGKVADFFTKDFKRGNAKLRTAKDIKDRSENHDNAESKKATKEAIKAYAKGGAKAVGAAGLTAAAIYAWYKKHKKNKGKKK